MSNKNLLNESTIRKFLKLASIEPLGSDFVGRIQEAEEELEEGHGHDDTEELDEAEEEIEEGKDKDEELEEASCGSHNRDDKAEEELDIDEMGGDMAYKDDEEELDMDMDMGAEAGAEAGAKMVDIDAFIGALEAALEKVMGEPADVDYEPE